MGRDCVLGKGVYVAEGAVIGNNVHVQNGVSIYSGVTLKDNVFIGPHVIFTNDPYPRVNSPDWTPVPTVVSEWASIGAGVVVVCGVRIGRYAMVGAGAVVTRDVSPHALVCGNPASLRNWVCRCGSPLCEVTKDDAEVRGNCRRCGEELVLPLDAIVAAHGEGRPGVLGGDEEDGTVPGLQAF